VSAGATTLPPTPVRSLDRAAAQALWSQAETLLGNGQLDLSEQVLRTLLASGATGPDVQYMLGYALLAQGRYEEGFKLYEARRNIPAFKIAMPPFPFPRWRGESLQGKRLLVWPEQGFGDQIMYARFALALARSGVSVAMAAPRPLVRLLQGTAVQILPTDEPIELKGDYVTLSGDLPLYCGARLDSLPPPWPITGTPGASRGRIGVVTNGDPKHANDANRSLPADVAAQLLALPGAISLRPEATGARDFQDTADIIAGLDLVITVDTSVAHLAASMGKPTWILLPHLRTDWRWLRNREDSPWYPSATLIRLGVSSDWAEVSQVVSRRISNI
jgi:hypothetical protein